MWDPNINLNLSVTAIEPSPVSVNQDLRSDNATSGSTTESSVIGIKRSSSQSSLVDSNDNKKSKIAGRLIFIIYSTILENYINVSIYDCYIENR